MPLRECVREGRGDERLLRGGRTRRRDSVRCVRVACWAAAPLEHCARAGRASGVPSCGVKLDVCASLRAVRVFQSVATTRFRSQPAATVSSLSFLALRLILGTA